ncbi:Protein sum2 [Schizosaccharomyces pombe]
MTEFIGSRISLISKSDIRYVGILQDINSQDSTLALKHVRWCGTEGRKQDPSQEIPPSDNVFDYIVFRGSDVKDLRIEEPATTPSAPPVQPPNDPAIIGSNSGQYNWNQAQTAQPPQPVQPNPYGAPYQQAPPAGAPYYMYPNAPAQFVPPGGLPLGTPLDASTPAVPYYGAPDQQQMGQRPEFAQNVSQGFAGQAPYNVRPGYGMPSNQKPPNFAPGMPAPGPTAVSASPSLQSMPPTNGVIPGAQPSIEASIEKESTSIRNSTVTNDRVVNATVDVSQSQTVETSGPSKEVPTTQPDASAAKPRTEFDFQTANQKFQSMKDDLLKGKNDEEAEEFYKPKQSFFDNISCESKEKGMEAADRRALRDRERSLNMETFGVAGSGNRGRRGRGRGRGGRGRGRGYARNQYNQYRNSNGSQPRAQPANDQ